MEINEQHILLPTTVCFTMLSECRFPSHWCVYVQISYTLEVHKLPVKEVSLSCINMVAVLMRQ